MPLKKFLGFFKNGNNSEPQKPASQAVGQTPYIKRAPRIPIKPLHNVAFHLAGRAPDERLELGNISLTGLGLLTEGLPAEMTAGSVIQGELLSKEKKIPITVRIVHRSDSVAGGAFQPASPELQSFVRNYFKVELQALTMRKVNPEMLAQVPEGTPHWYMGENSCELYYVMSGDKLLRYQLTFFGNYIEGTPEGAPKFGQVSADEDPEKPSYKGSSLVQWDPSMKASILESAIFFLACIPDLPTEIREKISAAISR